MYLSVCHYISHRIENQRIEMLRMVVGSKYGSVVRMLTSHQVWLRFNGGIMEVEFVVGSHPWSDIFAAGLSSGFAFP